MTLSTEIITLDGIPFTAELPDLLRRVRLAPDSPDAEDFSTLLEAARPIARPKAVFAACYLETLTDETATVSGVTFHSRTLSLNLAHAGRVFPFVATCGRELDTLPIPSMDFLARFWLDAIKEAALEASFEALNAALEARYALGKTGSMSPGSGDISVWAIEEQRLLFGLLGEAPEAIGVTLTDSCLMIPNKTVSGLVFPTEHLIRTCQVCQRADCPNRQAAFDPAAWAAIQP
jgi:hypothetical protein